MGAAAGRKESFSLSLFMEVNDLEVEEDLSTMARQLVVMTGQGWSRVDRDISHDAEFHDRPRATICWNMGPPNCALLVSLLYHQRFASRSSSLVHTRCRSACGAACRVQ